MNRVILAVVLATALQGCFTGIESTPRITAGDVRRQAAATPSPEMLFLAGVGSEPPARWQRGKRFYVADRRLRKLFAYTDGRTDSLEGTDLCYLGMETTPSLTADSATVLMLLTERGDTLRYRVDARPDDVMRRERLEIPFTVERDPVERADSFMRGNVYYIASPQWRTLDGRSRPGLRHVPVRVVRVEPGTDGIYSASVVFATTETPADTAMVMMGLGGMRAPRGFAQLFNFKNPRDGYPHITDEVWQRIIHSQVQLQMTRDECRLALGTPDRNEQIPTRAGMVERWSYGDGIFLIFEDGMLTSFRL